MENPFRKYCANIRQPDQASDSRGAEYQHQLPADHFFASASARARHFNWKTSDSSSYCDIDNRPHFCRKLKWEESVEILSGNCFSYPGTVRLVITPPHDVLRAAWARIAAFCRCHRK
ncbi:hypothetical protein GGI08_002412 [Coemansia sp. S2]|nr:hypothetical protein GGI08_002412 [Coemansia sp. S2]